MWALSNIWDYVCIPFHISGIGLRNLAEADFIVLTFHILPPCELWSAAAG